MTKKNVFSELSLAISPAEGRSAGQVIHCSNHKVIFNRGAFYVFDTRHTKKYSGMIEDVKGVLIC